MGNNSKNQHLVPATYLKNWAVDDLVESLTKHENGFMHPEIINIYSFNRKYQYYTLSAKDTFALTENDLDELYGDLEDLTIMLEDMQLRSSHELNMYYSQINKWIVFNDGELRSTSKIRNRIKNKRIYRIENELSKVEDKWSSFVEWLKSNIPSFDFIEFGVSEKHKKELLEFMFIQKNRTDIAYNELSEKLNIIYDLLGINNDMSEELFLKYLRCKFLKDLSDYFEGNNMSVINSYLNLEESFQLVFFPIVDLDLEYITSDNPCFKYIDSNFQNGIYNGIYFPITPKLVLMICKSSFDEITDFVFRKATEFRVETINRIIKENSYKYIVRKI